MLKRVPLTGLIGVLLATLVSGCTTTPRMPPETPAPEASTSEAAPTSAPADAAPGDSPSASPAASPPLDIASGLDAPWSLAYLDDTLLMSERDTGRIFEIDTAGNRREIGVVDGVVHGGEGGLLGLVVDAEGRLYAYSTGADGNRIQRIALEGSAGSLTLGDAETLVDGLPSNSTHNGGRLAFGPDGMLYAGVGDAGDPDSAQDPGSMAGKILRMTPDGEVPTDNPDPDSLVWSSGHRNVQGIAWAADGTMFATEFGQNTWDELNVVEPGENYGWPIVEGIADEEGFVDPVQQWNPADASPSGITVVGDTIFIANLRGATLRAVPVSDPGTSSDYLVGEYGRLRTVLEAPDGRLLILTNNTTGQSEVPEGDDRIVSIANPA